MSYQIQKIVEPVSLGEGPHWDCKQQALYFVSIADCTIHKYVPASGKHTRTKLGGRVGFIVPIEGKSDHFVIGLERKFVIIQWDGEEGTTAAIVREIAEIDKDRPKSRINDGKADPKGRLFAGTMGHEEPLGNVARKHGRFFRIDNDKVTTIEENIDISNGLAWDVTRKAMYYTDSLEEDIRRYDYDVATGEISNMKHIFDFKKNKIEGVPDGTTIDTDGNIWVAVFNGSCILKIDPTSGQLLQKIPIPAKQVTSVTFGGPNFDILFVTSASLTIDNEVQKPPCGATFMITGLGVRGHPNVNFKFNL